MRCHHHVYRRDTYRRTGRGPTGFEMHYAYGQCRKGATVGNHCKTHAECRWTGHTHDVSDPRVA